MAEIKSIDGNPIVIDVNDLSLYQDPETGYVYPVYRGEQSENGIPLAAAGGGGGGSATSVLTVTNKLDWLATTISKGAGCELRLEWSSTDQDIPTGEGTLTVTVDGSRKLTKSVAQGELRLEVGEYLSTGSQKVKVKIADSYDNSRTLTYTVTVVELTLASSFSTSGTFAAGQAVAYTYTPTGAVDKTVHFEVDGEEVATTVVTVSGRQQTQTIPAMAHGGHTLKVWFTAQVDGQTVSSNMLRHALVVVDPEATAPIIASAWAGTQARQYETVNVPYRVYTPNSLDSDVTLSVDGRQVAALTVDRTERTWAVRLDEVGTTQLTIASGGASKTFNVAVSESDAHIRPVTDDLELHLTSYGRSNAEEHPEVWQDAEHGVAATLSGFNFVSDGWLADSDGITALRVTGAARVEIPFQLFATDWRGNGRTLEVEFATSDVLDYDATVMSCWSGGRGFRLTAQRALLASSQSSISTQYKEDSHVRISFVADKRTEDRLLYIYINGIMSGVVQYPEDDNFQQAQPVGISIGSGSCTTSVYAIRVYSTNLTRYQILDNFVADTQDVTTMLERYRHNDVYDDYGQIVISKLPDDLPYLVIAGELPPEKGKKRTVSGYYVDPVDPTRSFSFEGAQADVQGTSSQYYPRKNYKIKFKGGFTMTSTGETVAKWAMRADAVPTSTFTFKADVASSEGANNVELVRLYDEACPYQTPPQAQDARVRQGIDGFPIVIFHDDGEAVRFVGKYNFNNDKGTPEVFGFADGDESWEIRNNNSLRTVFKSADFTGTAWLDDFEARYPDTDPAYRDPTALAALAAWLVSTDRDQATGAALPEAVTYRMPDETEDGFVEVTFTADTADYRLAKFRDEAPDHLEMDSALFYYLFTELFLMVDSRAKNAFPSFLGGDKWCWLPYDMDTAIGINNEGSLVFDYSLEDTDQVGGDDVYNGQTSVMWCNLRDAFRRELAAMYRELRSDGSLSYARVEGAFEEHQDKWPEAVFNEDAQFKYIDPLLDGGTTEYLKMAQGSKAEQRRWWLYNRFRYVDSKYVAGDAVADIINFRVYAKGDITITPYADIYPTARWESITVSERGHRGTATVLECPMSGTLTDANVIIFSASQLADVGDLSPLNVGLIDFSHATRLQRIKVGDASRTNTHMTGLSVGSNTLLASVDATNCSALVGTVDLSGAGNVEHALFAGTQVTAVTLPVGGILKELVLPATVRNLTVRDQGMVETFTMAGYSNVETLRVENSPAIPVDDILAQMAAGSRVRVIGLSRAMASTTEVEEFFGFLDTMGGLDESGGNVEMAVIAGEISIPGSVTGAWLAAMAARYPTITITAEHVTCDLRFWSWDGSTLLQTEQVVDGGDGTWGGTPSRASTAQYTFDFVGWSRSKDAEAAEAGATEAVAMDRDVYAAYSRTLRTYTVTWKNEGGAVLETDYNVPYGTVPTYNGATPTYQGETATGWTPAVGAITGDTVYTAAYGTPLTKYIARTITEVELSEASKVRAVAFRGCYSLTTASFPAATSIGSFAFYTCTALAIASFPVATNIGGYAFYSCHSLTTANFPVAETINASAFGNCYSLTTANFPVATSIGSSAFKDCTALTTINFPVVTSIGGAAFQSCNSLIAASFPKVTSIGAGAFQLCRSLTTANFPAVTYIGDYAFQSCSALATASFPAVTYISGHAFQYCYNLVELHLESVPSVPTLSSSVFTSTPIGGYSTSAGQYGSVFVPASLYEAFLTASNWSDIAPRIVSVTG